VVPDCFSGFDEVWHVLGLYFCDYCAAYCDGFCAWSVVEADSSVASVDAVVYAAGGYLAEHAFVAS